MRGIFLHEHRTRAPLPPRKANPLRSGVCCFRGGSINEARLLRIATTAEQQTTVVNDINQNITEIAGTSQQISQKADVNKMDVEKISALVVNLEEKMREFKL